MDGKEAKYPHRAALRALAAGRHPGRCSQTINRDFNSSGIFRASKEQLGR